MISGSERLVLIVPDSIMTSQGECNSSLCNQFWKTEAAETGVYSRILRVFQNSLPLDVINICN